MSDRREQILARILTILEGIRDFTTVARNLDEMPEGGRPCAVLIDGDETRSDTSEGIGTQPLIMNMMPSLSIGVSSTPEKLGQALSPLRTKVRLAILNDAQLQTLIGRKGRIRYEGLAGKLSHGSLMGADEQLNFSIFYTLNPADLA